MSDKYPCFSFMKSKANLVDVPHVEIPRALGMLYSPRLSTAVRVSCDTLFFPLCDYN